MATSGNLDEALGGLAKGLCDKLGDTGLCGHALKLVASHAGDERLALASLLRLTEESASSAREALRDPVCARKLMLTLGGSELTASELCAEGAGWLRTFEAACSETLDSLLGQFRCDATEMPDRAHAASAITRFKRKMFLKLAIADLTRAIDVTGTMTAMSRLADECIRAAFGAAVVLMGERAHEAGEFCVLALGKLGAGELNLSSDIDLVYIFDAPPTFANAHLAAARLGEMVTEILAAQCFRVDMRLRPGGRNSPLVVPFEGALGFYQGLGQTWERAVLLRARPVAGSLELGQRLLNELIPFIYRRYLDFDTLRQLRAMKREIEAELRSPAMIRRNIKLGYGGIRELEFVVQALTLIYGGRDPRIRVAKTVDALERLAAFGYLPRARAKELAQAYLFLRDAEHKLQVVAGLQTHVLPEDEAGMRALAARLGYAKELAALEGFEAALEKYRSLVATQFRETLAGGESERENRVSEAAEAAWNRVWEPTRAAAALHKLGFSNPAESSAHLNLLVQGPPYAPASPRRTELLAQLGPVLLDEISALPNPDVALSNLAAFIAAVGARTSFLALLEQHPATRRVLLRLFASSIYLSTLFIRHPEMLDTLVRSDLARPHRERDELAGELAAIVEASPNFESRLDAIRTFRHQEFLRVAIADLAGALSLHEVEGELTAIAETVLRVALELARAEIRTRLEIPPGFALCCVALGRLGAAEMSYNSDLDLIFVYEGDSVAMTGHEAAWRIAQKLIAILQTRTREGYAYKLDLRLRPSGNQGPLVTSFEGFVDYHRRHAAVWERQAFVRARVVAGEPALADKIEAARNEFVFGRGLTQVEVQKIAAMRARMEREIGAKDHERLNLKQGRGGLVDVDFVAQMMALAYGHERPELRTRSTLALLRAIGKLALVPAEDAKTLEDGYEFFARLENRLRIETDQAAWAVPRALEALRPLALRMGYRGKDAAERLLADIERRRAAIRAAFERCFASRP